MAAICKKSKLQPKHYIFATRENGPKSAYIQNHKRFGLAAIEITSSQKLQKFKMAVIFVKPLKRNQMPNILWSGS